MQSGEIEAHDIYNGGNRIRVSIYKPENVGEEMCIDEKYINQDFYTVLSNPKTNKIAALIQSTKSNLLAQALHKMGSKLLIVKTLNRDLSQTYDWVGRQVFMNAQHVADKFHVMRHAFDSLQSIRIAIKNFEAQAVADAEQAHLARELKFKKEHKEKYDFHYQIKPYKHKYEILENGDTIPQLLARSRYLLFKPKGKWSSNQKARAEILFKRYPDLGRAHELIISFRKWFSSENIGKQRKTILKQLNRWYKNIKEFNLAHLSLFSALVKRNEGSIMNYFKQGSTNAKAEAMNSRIQSFIHSNRGVRNLDFFLYRLAGFFS